MDSFEIVPNFIQQTAWTRRLQAWAIALLCIVTIAGCAQTDSEPSPSAQAPAEATTTDLPTLDGKATVVMVVNGESIEIEVNGEAAPVTAGNFVDLVQKDVYDGTAFHRVVRTPEPFVVQGGDPLSKDADVPVSRLGTGSYVNPDTQQPRYIPLEIKPEGADEPVYGQTLSNAGVTEPPVLMHERGAVAMARSTPPNSASAQFYFALSDLAFLDGDYAVFGYVTEGMDVVDNIQQGDRLESATVVDGLDNLK